MKRYYPTCDTGSELLISQYNISFSATEHHTGYYLLVLICSKLQDVALGGNAVFVLTMERRRKHRFTAD